VQLSSKEVAMPKKSIGQLLVEGLEDLTSKLKAGVPIEGTRMRRIDTPDGPAYVREHSVLNVPETPIPEGE
jgi:hypothetical protein